MQTVTIYIDVQPPRISYHVTSTFQLQAAILGECDEEWCPSLIYVVAMALFAYHVRSTSQCPVIYSYFRPIANS